MRNNYPGTCYRCKQLVKEKEGHFELIPYKERKTNVRWRLQHASCAIFYRGTKVGKEKNHENPM